MLRFRLMVTAAAGCLLASATTAAAQQAPTPNTNAEINSAFQGVLSNPSDLAAGQTYANLLIDSGNYEGGIAALEDLLTKPNADPAIRVQLAYLYYRLGSYAAAESYARAALDDQRLSAQSRKSAEALLADLESRNAPGGRLTGNISIGARVQSNPTAGPSSDSFLAGGTRVEVPHRTKPDGDFDGFITANAQHEYDFDTQNSATLVTTGNLFANHYADAAAYNDDKFKSDPQDLFALNLTSGIRFKPAPASLSGLAIRPYVAGSEWLLDGHQYYGAAGGGIDADYSLNDGATLIGATYDIRRTMYADRGDIENSDKQSGYEQFLQLRAVQEVARLKTISASVILRDHATDADYFDYRSVEIRMAFSTGYSNPFAWDERLWTTTFYAGPTYRGYGGADPTVDPGKTRHDLEWRLGITQVIPVTDSLGVTIGVEYTNVNSNLSNYSYNNVAGMTSINWTF